MGVDFAGVVKAHPITPSSPGTAPSGTAIDSAASKLSAAAYPLMKGVDWTSDLYQKPIPGKSPQEVLKAIDGMDAKGVLSQADFEAINAGLGKAIASVPTGTVMDVYNAMAKVVGSSPVPNYLYSTVNAQDAQAAYNA